jgi:hypothetical protein
MVPITDSPNLATGNLIFNFYPPTGGTASTVDDLKTTDSALFYTA